MRSLALIGIGLATFLLALAYALSGIPAGTVVIGVFGLLWLIGPWRDGSAIGSVGLISLTSAAAFGLWLGLPAGWMLLSTVAALVAWDLDDFSYRLRKAEQVSGELELKQFHLQRLLVVAGLGLLLGGIALSVRVDLGFWWALFLGLLAILCLSQAFRAIRHQSN